MYLIRHNKNFLDNCIFYRDVDVYKNSINNGISSGVDNPVQFYLVIKNLSLQWNNVNEYVKENNSIFEGVDK